MNEKLISVQFVIADADRGLVAVRVEGAAGSPALGEVIRAADEALGRPFSVDSPSRLLGFPVDGDYWEELGADYVEIPGDATFADLAQIVGPDGYSVRFQHDGFGGDGFLFDGLTAWTLSELIEFGRDALEIWGAVEVAHRLGRASRRRARRQRRLVASQWIHHGGPVPVLLRQAVERQRSWHDETLAAYFELDRAEGQRLMEACGYQWSEKRGVYYSPNDPDAVN